MSDLDVILREWESVGPDTVDSDRGLHGFSFDDPAHRKIAKELTRSGRLRFLELRNGLQIEARAHVGRVQIGRLTVTVVPKIAPTSLLTLFRYAHGLRDLSRHHVASYSTTGLVFQDLVIAQLHSEVQILLDRGIARTYQARHEELASPRGKIDFARLAVRGDRGSACLPCRHYPRLSDHLLNRVVLAGLTLAQYMVDDPGLRLEVARQRRLMAEMAGHEELSAELLARAGRKLNRLVAPYISIIGLVEILYFGSFLDLTARGGRRRLPGFLFDMNRFFQSLIGRFLSDNLPEFHVESELGLTEMMRYVPGRNPLGRRAPRPRPDYAIKKKNGEVVTLLDAKYRDLWEKTLPREMLYQLTVYALSQQPGTTAAILHPTTDPAARPSRIEILDPSSGTNAGYVELRPVQVDKMVQMIELAGETAGMIRTQWAKELAGVVGVRASV